MSANSAGKSVRRIKPGSFHDVGPGGLSAAAFARWYRRETLARWKNIDIAAVAQLADAVEATRRSGHRVYVVGNGGSAATASHIATDFSKTASVLGHDDVQCLSLADNSSYITAIGNDLSFDDIFARQLEPLLMAGDLVILISGSGNSANLLKAARLAHARGAVTAALLGFDGGKLKKIVDVSVLIPSIQYGVIEDMHLAIGHIVTFFIKQLKQQSRR